MNRILPNGCLEKYQQLLGLFMQLQEMVADVPPPVRQTATQIVSQNFQELQDFYQQQIFSLVEEHIEEQVPLEIASRWRSLQTEIHRSMKLLERDISLFKAARSPQMQQTRKQGMSDRLSTLISYCQVILALASANF